MRFAALIAILMTTGPAAAQPGGSDLVVEPQREAPPPTDEYQPPPEHEPAQPQGPPVYQPPADATIRATFVSTTQDNWDVWVDQKLGCSTPCTLPLSPLSFVALRTQERNPIRLDVGYIPPGDVMVHAKPLSQGVYATGITFTALSGMGLATGITLTAVGCATDRDGMCTAGIITGGASAFGLFGGIYLMRKALPRATIGRAQPYATTSSVGLAGRF